MRQSFTGFFIFLLTATPLLARPLERVPQDGSLAQALQRVNERGTIEIASGTYVAPANGFRLRNKSVTLRAIGPDVILDGQGNSVIFTITDQGVGTGRSVAFEGITFRNGFSSSTTLAGAVTLTAANASFVSCTFEANATGPGVLRGGAVQLREGSYGNFVNSRFEGNTAGQWGGAIFAIEDSKADVVWSEFEGNRTDLPGQGPVPAGGAIYALNSDVYVTSSHFRDNASGWVGGALYALGEYLDPVALPRARLRIDNSTFVNNRAAPNACCSTPGGQPSTGGAIHVENQALLEVRNSRFRNNQTNWGGAIASYRAQVEIHDSFFRNNRAVPVAGIPSAGGTLNLTSGDFADVSTDFGAFDRPVASLTMSHTLIEGRTGGATTERSGGCLFAQGDSARLRGIGVPQTGTAADHRIPVVLEDVVLNDCDVETGSESNGLGGAIFANLADVTLEDSLIMNSDALGNPAAGGAILTLDDTVLRATGTTFARNSGETGSGGIQMNGGRIEVDDCFFLENDFSPGVAENAPGSLGASMTLGPANNNNIAITGSVTNSIFTGDIGLSIFDVDNDDGPPFNNVVYDGNRINNTTFGNQVYKNNAVAVRALTVAELNNLVINRPGGGTTRKSDVPNTFLPNPPREGHVVAAPSQVLSTTAPRDPAPSNAFLGYAWSGGNGARLNGRNLGDMVGIEEFATPANYRLFVADERQDTAVVGATGCNSENVLCLSDERFLIEVFWRDFSNNFGKASTVLGGSNDSGLYWFFSEDNWEMLVKVLSGCNLNDHFWVFAAATTDVEYTLRVTDKLSGATKSYFNPLGAPARAITDTEALAACDAGNAASSKPFTAKGGAGACSETPSSILLNRGRFRAEIDWRDFNGNSGSAQVVNELCSDDSGLFFFFTEDNWEMLVKILTGCNINNHFWVFAAATTNVEYTLTVTDTETGQVKRYRNPLGTAASAITDTEAFPTCP